MDETGIKLNKETLDRLQKKIFSETASKEAEDVEKEYEKVNKAAKEFIHTLNNFLKEKGKNEDEIDFSTVNFEEANYIEAKKAVRYSLSNDKVTQAILDFEEAFNDFMGRKIVLTAVDETGKVFFYDHKGQSDIYLKSGGKNNKINPGHISLTFSHGIQKAELSAIFDEVFKTKEENTRARQIEEVYRVAMERYDETHEGAKSGTDNNFIYWHDPGTIRKYAFVKSKGLLGEGYLRALFSFDSNLSSDKRFSNQLDKHNLENYYYNYVVKADNRAGSVAGDIADDILDSMQLAVKTKKGASSQAFGNLVTIAEYIINNKATAKSMKEWIETKEKEKNKEFPNSPLIKNLKQRLTEEVKNSVEGQGYTVTYVTETKK